MAKELASCRIRMSSIAFWDMRIPRHDQDTRAPPDTVGRPRAPVQPRGHIELVRQSPMNSGSNDNEDAWTRSLEGSDVRQPAPAGVGAKCPGCAYWRSLKRWILPVAVFGSSATNSSHRGY